MGWAVPQGPIQIDIAGVIAQRVKAGPAVEGGEIVALSPVSPHCWLVHRQPGPQPLHPTLTVITIYSHRSDLRRNEARRRKLLCAGIKVCRHNLYIQIMWMDGKRRSESWTERGGIALCWKLP